MAYQLFIGVDTGSEKLDYHVLNDQEVEYGSGVLDNTEAVIAQWAEQLVTNYHLPAGQFMICIENTGTYSLRMAYELHLRGFAVWMQDAYQIKQSIGRVRSKTDQLDAFRIARYAVRNQADFQVFVPDSRIIASLRSLTQQRQRLIKVKNLLLNGIRPEKHIPDAIAPTPDCYEQTQSVIGQVLQGIKAINKKIEQLLKQDQRFKRTMEILLTQPGIGKVTALEIILRTKNFSMGYNAAKIASLVGVAPHRYESGKSIRRKPRSQKSTDKTVKTCLYMGMLRCTRIEGKMNDYYQRKRAEGKHHNVIINAMANITIRTLCACLKKDVIYDENFKHHLQVS